MKIFNQNELNGFSGFTSNARKRPIEWRSIQINLHPAIETPQAMSEFFLKLQKSMPFDDGAFYIENPGRINAFMHVDNIFNPKMIETAIVQNFPDYKCKMHGRPSDEDGLRKIEINLFKGSALSRMREKRQEKIIMLVDDDNFLRGLIANALNPFGQVIECSEAKNVIELYRKTSPDLVFLDIHLPDSSGIDVLKEILETDAQAAVIMISSDSARENVLDTMALGATWFLSKPFTKEKILESVRKSAIFENV